ncbi:thioredoxin-disulfide reductase [Candidatus Desantisbacteria bacterium]|nr:thioredoxin-disulfide reductase [Candidatus Desantisbacteria bacterium]
MSEDIIYDVIIIGGGPAGLTAGIYTARARLTTLLLNSYTILGQAVSTNLIENYPGFPDGIGGFELIERFEKQAQGFGLTIYPDTVKGISPIKRQGKNVWQIEAEDGMYYAVSLIIATGASHKELGVPGESEFHSKGVSYCATCDGPLYKGKSLIVVGGGDAAVEEALFLTKFSPKIMLVHRRDSLRAANILQERLFAHKSIDVIWNSTVTDILGSTVVEGVRIKNVLTQESMELDCSGVFMFIGLVPNTRLFQGIIKLDDNGYIVTDEHMMTSQKSIFACGDCRQTPFRQVITACGDGATAGFAVSMMMGH